MTDVAVATFMLLVTWFGPGGSSSYQAEFTDLAKCQRAVVVLQAEQARLQQGLAGSVTSAAVQVQSGNTLDPSRPIVTAVCIER